MRRSDVLVTAPVNKRQNRRQPPTFVGQPRATADKPALSPRRIPLDVRVASIVWWPVASVLAIVLYPDRAYARLRMKWLPAVMGFTWAHLGGLANRHVLAERKVICQACPHRRVANGRTYCGPAISRCGCPVRRWWIPAQLRWMIRLRRFACPVERF